MMQNTPKDAKALKFLFAALHQQFRNKTGPLFVPRMFLKVPQKNSKLKLHFNSEFALCSVKNLNKREDPTHHEDAKDRSNHTTSKSPGDQGSSHRFYEHYSILAVPPEEAKELYKYLSEHAPNKDMQTKFPNLGKLCEDLFYLKKGISLEFISKSLQGRILSGQKNEKFVFIPTEAITQTIFRTCSLAQNVFFTGPTSVGKSCSLALLAIILRTNPSNRVIFIHSTSAFVDAPILEFIDVMLAAFEPDFTNNPDEDAQNLKEKLFSLSSFSPINKTITEDEAVGDFFATLHGYLRKKNYTIHFILDQHNAISKLKGDLDQKNKYSKVEGIISKLRGLPRSFSGKLIMAGSTNDEEIPLQSKEFFTLVHLTDEVKREEAERFVEYAFDKKYEEDDLNIILTYAGHSFGEINCLAKQNSPDLNKKLSTYLDTRTQEFTEILENKFIEPRVKAGISRDDILDAINQILICGRVNPAYGKYVDDRIIRKGENGDYKFVCLPAERACESFIYKNHHLLDARFNLALKERRRSDPHFRVELEYYFINVIIRSLYLAKSIAIETETEVYQDGKVKPAMIAIAPAKSIDLRKNPLTLVGDINAESEIIVRPAAQFPVFDLIILNKAEVVKGEDENEQEGQEEIKREAIFFQIKSTLRNSHIEEYSKYKNNQLRKLGREDLEKLLGITKVTFVWVYCELDEGLDRSLLEDKNQDHYEMRFIQVKDLPLEFFGFDRELLERSSDFKKK